MDKMETELPAARSDSDDSSSDDNEDETAIARADELERQIAANKYLYDEHVELVGLYRKLGELQSIRQAYERFHECFPLTPKIWLELLNDEKKLSSSEKDVEKILKLFDQAVEDYLSVELWLEYVQYSIGASNLKTTREILERALTAAGLHANGGGLLWDMSRELELAQLSFTKPNADEYKEQLARIAGIFKRQLSVPLMGMEETYKEWEIWLESLPEGHNIDPKPIEWGYQKAQQLLKIYKPFENKLLATTDETELYKIYKEYIDVLKDPSTIMCVYERAVAQLCLNPVIWVDYCMYSLKFGDTAIKVSHRALRNCPWSAELWVTRLRILEHVGKETSEVLKTFEEGITNFAGAQGLELWLGYLEYVNRTSDDKEKLYKLFDLAIENLGCKNDANSKVIRWYARILAKNGDMASARRLWKNILKGPQNKGAASVWLEFANLERQYGETGQLRNLFERALASCTDWPQFIAEEWLMFEREHGKLEDVLKCIEKCKGIPPIQPVNPVNEEPTEKGKKRKIQSDHSVVESKKFKSDKQPLFAKKVPIAKDPTKTVFVSNLYPSINENRLKKIFPNAVNVEIVVDRKGKSRCYGYVQFSIEEEVAVALARDRELLDGRPIFISTCKPDRNERKQAFKYSADAEANKLFVRGLPVDKTMEEVKDIFKPYGAIAVRLVLHKSGQPKGLAYVEFVDEESAKKALLNTNGMKVGEHNITVAVSAPPQKNAPKATEVVRHARSRLQIPMIPRTLQVKSDTNGQQSGAASKSNEDFRKMFLKN